MKNSEFYFTELRKCINKTFTENKFPDTLKLSDIVSAFKKLDPTVEKIMYDQLYEYGETFLNKLLCVFGKLSQCSMHFSDFFRDGTKG